MLADASTSLIDSSLNAFNSGIDTESGIVGSGLTATPSSYNSDIFNIVHTICNVVVAPVGGMILVIILCYEMISMMIGYNSFKDIDTEFIFKWILKAFCGIVLISHTGDIIIGVFDMGSGLTQDALFELNNSAEYNPDSLTTVAGNIKELLMNEFEGKWGILFTFLIFSFIMFIALYASLVIVMLIVISRLIEAFMYISVAPIPMSTFMNKEWGTIGTNWLRNIFAIAFQGIFIVVALGVFRVMFVSTIASLADFDTSSGANPQDLYFNMISCVVWAVALCFTIFRSSSISKSIFNAH